MVIISNLSYPPESANDIAKRFLEAPQLPDYLVRRGPYITSSADKGIQTVSIYECDKSKMPETYEFLGNYMATFFGVPGFRYEYKPFMEVAEALKMIGMG